LVVKRGEKTPRFSAGKNMPYFENFSVENHLESPEVFMGTLVVAKGN
jgi:hypothetical protein